MKNERELAEMAQQIDAYLRAIRRELRKPLATEIARGELTAPQRNIMQILVGVAVGRSLLTARCRESWTAWKARSSGAPAGL